MSGRKWAGRVTLGILGAAAVGAWASVLWQLSAVRADPEEMAQVELEVDEIARCNNGQAVLVLRERDGDRRLPIPITSAEAATLEKRLRATGAIPAGHDQGELARSALSALGGKVLHASIDAVTRDHTFLGHVTLAQGRTSLDLDARPTDSIALALDARAPIYVSPEVLAVAGLTPGEARSLIEASRGRSSGGPVPVLSL